VTHSFWLRRVDTGEFAQIVSEFPELRLFVYSEWGKDCEISQIDPWVSFWFSTGEIV